MANFVFFLGLTNFLRGRITAEEFSKTEPLISKIKVVNPDNLGDSLITFEFDRDDDLLNFLGLGDDDIWFYNSLKVGLELFSEDSAEEDMIRGWSDFWKLIDEDNLEKFKQISKFLGLGTFSDDSDKERAALYARISDVFPKQTHQMVSEFVYEVNQEMRKVAEEHMEKDIKEFLESNGFKQINEYTIQTKASNFLRLILKNNLSLVPLNLIFKQILSTDGSIGLWYDMAWEYRDSDEFDSESFNRSVSQELDNIMDLQEEMIDKGFLKVIDRITKRFKVGVWYEIPKNKNFIFRITGFNKHEMKIEVDLKERKKDPSTIKKFKFSEDSFNNLLHQLELFKFGEFNNF